MIKDKRKKKRVANADNKLPVLSNLTARNAECAKKKFNALYCWHFSDV